MCLFMQESFLENLRHKSSCYGRSRPSSHIYLLKLVIRRNKRTIKWQCKCWNTWRVWNHLEFLREMFGFILTLDKSQLNLTHCWHLFWNDRDILTLFLFQKKCLRHDWIKKVDGFRSSNANQSPHLRGLKQSMTFSLFLKFISNLHTVLIK